MIDACLTLRPEQLRTAVPGTYGSILDTMRHLVDGDSSYLRPMTDEPTALIDAERLDLPQLRAVMEGHGAAWSRLLAQDLGPDADFVEHDDGCTALTVLGVDPPAIDVWDYGLHTGRSVESGP